MRLQERYRRMAKSSADTYAANTRYFLAWADSTPALAAVLAAIERSEPDLDAAEWYESVESQRLQGEWPEAEVGRAKIALHVLRRIADGAVKPFNVGMAFSNERNVNDALRDFSGEVVEPLIEYLQERLSAESDMLYVLERYRRRVLWFEQARLWAAYQADTARGEATYDEDLRRFLFDQGVDFPFSQPVSPSGRADVVAQVDGDDPLPMEVKLFDGGSYGAAYLAKGVAQALRYAEDYGKTEAYLVIFNLTERPIALPTDDADSVWPERIVVAGVTVFLIVVQAAPRPAASKSGQVKPWTISRAQLVAAE